MVLVASLSAVMNGGSVEALAAGEVVGEVPETLSAVMNGGSVEARLTYGLAPYSFSIIRRDERRLR